MGSELSVYTVGKYYKVLYTVGLQLVQTLSHNVVSNTHRHEQDSRTYEAYRNFLCNM